MFRSCGRATVVNLGDKGGGAEEQIMNAGAKFLAGYSVVSTIFLRSRLVLRRNFTTARSLVLLERVAVAACLLAAVSSAFPSPAHGAWVNMTTTPPQFQVGGKLTEVVPTLVSTAPGIANSPALVDPTCGNQGGTSLALVRGVKLAGVNPVLYPVVLVVSCLDNGGSATTRSRLNFINPVTVTDTNGAVGAGGIVVKQITTTITVNGVAAAFAPSNGWAHLVHRPDKGDLLGCGADGILYSIDYSQTSSATDGAVTKLSTPVLGSCGGLAWDAENDTIYQGVAGANGNKIGSVARFKEGAAIPDNTFATSLSCPANGLAISGGVVLVSCAGLVNNTLVIQRLDKTTGANLGLYPSISLPVPGSTTPGFLGLTALGNSDPGLGDLACDPVTFQRDTQSSSINPLGRDLYRDALWSRRGTNGNGVAAIEFPAFTCGAPSTSVALAPGLSMPGLNGQPGQFPLAACFDGSGIVKDDDGDGLPNCWEQNAGGSTGPGGIDFDGDGTPDFILCAQVNINGDGTTLTTECADPNHKDLFVEVGWMANHQPDPQALSQTQSVATVGVQSVREAFGAAPVFNPDNNATTPNGIRLHIQVDKQPLKINPADGISPQTNHVTYVALTPCTGAATTAPTGPPPGTDAADYDAIKALNFGMFDANNPPSPKAVNAMRLAVRYVVFAHNLVGNPQGGSSSSGCSEVAGDDAVVSLGSFTTTTVNGISHGRGSTDQQAGTFMHEFGHLLGFQHGGEDTINNKPNYRSVMSYSRQFSGSPITGRRLDYSRSEADLSEANLNECLGIGVDPTLGAIPGRNPGDAPFFASPDQIAFGPGGWSVVTPSNATASSPCLGGLPINWNRQTSQGKVFQQSTSADLNSDGSNTTLFGSNDWANVLYRFSAAIDFAGGAGRENPLPPGVKSEMTKTDETLFFLQTDSDGNGVGDGQDCGTAVVGSTTALRLDTTSTTIPFNFDPKFDQSGLAPAGTGYLGPNLGPNLPPDAFGYNATNSNSFTGVTGVDGSCSMPPCLPPQDFWPMGTRVLAPFLCTLHDCGIGPDGNTFMCHTHRIDIKPSAPLPKVINLGTEANVTIAIFSEVNWNAPAEIQVDAASLQQHPLTFTVGGVTQKVKTNNNGSGTCSISDVADPITGQKDGIKDLKCQFPTSGLPTGTNFGLVSGFFLDPLTNQFTAFSARQEVTILP